MASTLTDYQTQKTTEWVTGGTYAVAIEVDARVLPGRPGELFLTPEAIRHLEQIRREAEAGNVEALKRAGQVYQLLGNGANRSS